MKIKIAVLCCACFFAGGSASLLLRARYTFQLATQPEDGAILYRCDTWTGRVEFTGSGRQTSRQIQWWTAIAQ